MNKSMLILSLGAVAVLGACRGGDAQMEAGRWEMTSSVTDMSMPGAPPEVIEQAKAQKDTKMSCLTEEEARAPLEKMMSKGGDQACRPTDMKMEGGKISGKVSCQQGGGQLSADISGTYGADRIEMEMATKIQNPAAPGQQVEMTVRMDGRRVGACDGTETKS
jgi:hypothetical protein